MIEKLRVLFIVLVLFVLPTAVSAQVLLEDDFSGEAIDPTKWIAHGTGVSIDEDLQVLRSFTDQHFYVDGLESAVLFERPAPGLRLVFEGRFKHDAANPRCASNLYLQPAWGFNESRIYLEWAKDQVGDEDQIFCGVQYPGYSDLAVRGSFVPGEWQDWRVVVYSVGCEVYIDDVCIYCGVFEGDFPMKLCIDGSQPAQTSYWDDIRVTLQDATPPIVTCDLDRRVLWPPRKKLVDVGMDVLVEDDVDPEPTFDVLVYSDEGDRSRRHAPDAVFRDGRLLLTAERNPRGDGRVYLIVVMAMDAFGNTAFDCCSVVVPRNRSRRAMRSVAKQARDAVSFCDEFGEAPPGFELIGQLSEAEDCSARSKQSTSRSDVVRGRARRSTRIGWSVPD